MSDDKTPAELAIEAHIENLNQTRTVLVAQLDSVNEELKLLLVEHYGVPETNPKFQKAFQIAWDAWTRGRPE